MTSDRKAQANRTNAQNSTGPKTACGKARAARNARRLGLSLSVLGDPVLSDQVAVLTHKIAGETSDANIFELARRVAEAQIDLQRVRQARHRFFFDRLNGLGHARSQKKASDPNFAIVDPPEFATILCSAPRRLKQSIATSGGHYHAAGLLFAHSMLSGRIGIIPIETKTIFGRTKPISVRKTKFLSARTAMRRIH